MAFAAAHAASRKIVAVLPRQLAPPSLIHRMFSTPARSFLPPYCLRLAILAPVAYASLAGDHPFSPFSFLGTWKTRNIRPLDTVRIRLFGGTGNASTIKNLLPKDCDVRL